MKINLFAPTDKQPLRAGPKQFGFFFSGIRKKVKNTRRASLNSAIEFFYQSKIILTLVEILRLFENL